jgi:PhnB protein
MDQIFVPMLSYEDGVAALEWLKAVFGFEEVHRWLDADGRLAHGELKSHGQVLMLATPTPEYQSPKTVRANYPPAAHWSELPYVMNGVLIYVDDLDKTYANAKTLGGRILSEIDEGPPGRRFRLEDPEGQRFYVFERTATVGS